MRGASRSTANASAARRSPRLLPRAMRDLAMRHGYCSIHRVGSTPPPVPAPSARRPSRSVRPASACSKNRLCSSVSPRITLQHVAVARVGHRLDPRPPLVDERLRRVAVGADAARLRRLPPCRCRHLRLGDVCRACRPCR